MNIAKLSDRKLRALIAEREAAYMALIDQVIAAGFYGWEWSEIKQYAELSSLTPKVKLIRAYIASWEAQKAAYAEFYAREDRRKRAA